MSAALLITFISAAVGPNVSGQDSTPLQFDVAVVRAVHESEPGGYRHQITPTGVTMRAVSMGYCIRLAYGLSVQRPWELTGPSWIDPPTEFIYDISAKTSGPTTEDQIKAMLQTLLADRFKIVVHREKRSLPAYALMRTGNAPSIRTSDPNGSRNVKRGAKPYELIFEHATMADLALQLGPPMTSRPVFDATNLPGYFDFALDLGRYVADPETNAPVLDARGVIDTEAATLRAVRDQLGLVLRPDRSEFEILVIDHVEKRPTAN